MKEIVKTIKVDKDVEMLCDIFDGYISSLVENIDNTELSEECKKFYSILSNLHPLNHIDDDVDSVEIDLVANIHIKSCKS